MAVSAEVSNANDSSSSLYLLRDVSLISSWVLVDIKRDLIKSNIECGQRGLKQSAKWQVAICAMIVYSLIAKLLQRLYNRVTIRPGFPGFVSVL